jgi:radical SAM superfamily enzyme YgiQ (UPF0313 family)
MYYFFKLIRVLFLYPLPSPSSPSHFEALSIIYPGRAAEDAGYDVEYWDARLDSEEELFEMATSFDVFAISSLSGFQLGESMRIATKLKRLFPEKPIIWGGVHVTFQPVDSLEENIVDYVVLGEGERRFVQLLNSLRDGNDISTIDGVGFKKESVGINELSLRIFTQNRLPILDFGAHFTEVPNSKMKGRIELHDPDGCYNGHIHIKRRGQALDLEREYIHPVSIKTARFFLAAAKRNQVSFPDARGCAWSGTSCKFCSVEGQYTAFSDTTGKSSAPYRWIPFEFWEKDIRAIYALHPFTYLEVEHENGTRWIQDWRYAELCKELGIGYHVHLRSDQLKKDVVVKKLADTGCIRVHVGAESGDQRTLDLMNKNEKVEDHYAAAKLLGKYGIEMICTWIIGTPGETVEGIINTLLATDIIASLLPPGKSRSTVYVLMPLPGTPVYVDAINAGWPLPKTMTGWTDISAACNPTLPPWMNYVYFIAGFHHNKKHKTAKNFPGWWRLLIAPFEIDIEIRWWFAMKTKNITFFKFFVFEYWAITKLLGWRSKRSIGETHKAKGLERYIPGTAGH